MQGVRSFERNRIIGQHTIELPKCPEQSKIAGYDLPIKDQRFRRTELPADFRKWESERRKEFIAEEWRKRLNGYWFYNHGNIEYITGLHYFYCAWWKIGTWYPIWTDADRDFFYVWKMVEDTSACDGLLYITGRGSGKTKKSTAVIYEPISRSRNVFAGIQSKTEPDAKKIFNQLVYSWSKLPSFFRPIDVGNSKPANLLDFSAPATRSTKEQEKDDSDVLNSSIDYRSAGVSAYDGDTLYRIFLDEIGKTTEADVDERTKTIRECLRAGLSEYGRGKALSTTTVEEMEKRGGKNAKKVWDGADRTKLDSNGFTKNGMFRLFAPADYGYLEIMDGHKFIDEYGYSLRDKAKQFFMNKRKSLDGNDLNSEKRKFPLEERDIWVSDSRISAYDQKKIDEQFEINDALPPGTLVKGQFQWANGVKDTTVEWVPTPQGLWEFSWFPPPEQWNAMIYRYSKKAPGNTHVGNFGLDPFDNRLTMDKSRRSDAAAYGYWKYDANSPYESDNFIGEYVGRPPLPELMYRQMLLACIYFGWQIHIENNKQGCIDYFRREGYDLYLMPRPAMTKPDNFDDSIEIEAGTPMSGVAPRQSLIDVTESYIYRKVGWIEELGKVPRAGRCYFNKLLSDWKDYDVQADWTRFDKMVGAGLCLIGAVKYEAPEAEKPVLISLFDQYSHEGSGSVRITPEGPPPSNKDQKDKYTIKIHDGRNRVT